jgi:hypothetical protein
VVSSTLLTVTTTCVKAWPASTVEACGVENRSTALAVGAVTPLPAGSVKEPPTLVAVRVGASLTGVTATVDCRPSGALILSFGAMF